MAKINIKVLGMKTSVEDTNQNRKAFKDLRSALKTLFGNDEIDKPKKLRAFDVIEETVTRDGDEIEIED